MTTQDRTLFYPKKKKLPKWSEYRHKILRFFFKKHSISLKGKRKLKSKRVCVSTAQPLPDI